MSQTSQLLDALKKTLKARGLAYRDVAAALMISEASVKRIFSERTFTLQRLEDVCRLLDMNIYELAKLTRMRSEGPPLELSESQESVLADDPVLLTYFYLLITGWTPPRIARKFDLDERSHRGYLKTLDRLKLIDLLPKNRIRLLTGRRINWLKNGPVRRLYEARVKAEFLRSRFDAADELMRLESGELSDASIKLLRRRIDQLGSEFEEYAESDLNLPREQKRAFALLLAFRPWTFWSFVESDQQSSHLER